MAFAETSVVIMKWHGNQDGYISPDFSSSILSVLSINYTLGVSTDGLKKNKFATKNLFL